MSETDLRNYIRLLWIAFGILTLWFLLGFVAPLAIYKDVEFGGKLGDSFGVVNSLFSAFAFLGLIYTINLQLENLKETRRQGQLNMYFKLLDDLRSDLVDVKFENKAGFEAWHAFAKYCDLKVYLSIQRSTHEDAVDGFLYVFKNRAGLMTSIYQKVREDKVIGPEDVKLLQHKLAILFFESLQSAVQRFDHSDVDQRYAVFTLAQTASEDVWKEYISSLKMVSYFDIRKAGDKQPQ